MTFQNPTPDDIRAAEERGRMMAEKWNKSQSPPHIIAKGRVCKSCKQTRSVAAFIDGARICRYCMMEEE